MAFSTQKDFFHVPFMNESVEYGCKKACVKLKSYESTIDDRSWATDEAKQSKFLTDLVTCQLPMGYGDGNDIGGRGEFGGHGESGHGEAGRLHGPGISADKGDDDSQGFAGKFTGLNAGDSLLQCANVHLAEYQKFLNVKKTLEKQLEASNERLRIANEENKKIQEILASKLDSNTAKDFFNKIQKLTAAGKLGKNEENEMLQIYQKMENMIKSYEILQAENYYLKCLIEKLYVRTTFDSIQTKPEKSTDVLYLQKEVNTLRKECIMLRQIEDDYLKIKQQTNKSTGISEQDAENIKAIIKERNSLREKCKTFEAMKEQMQALEKQAIDASKDAGRLSSTLSNQSQYIDKMENEMRDMQKYYEGQNQNACFTEECLKSQIEDLKTELMKARCQAQKADLLTMEICNLRKELLNKDLALNDYDCQYKQIMDVVAELQAVKLQCLNDNQTQTCKHETDDLAFYTCATLDEIMKELQRKGCFTEEFMAAYGFAPEGNKECCKEMQRLQEELADAKRQLEEGANCAAICADALKRLQELEDENNRLLQANQALNNVLKEKEEKLTNMLNKLEQLGIDIDKNGEDANRIGKDLEGTLGLVKDITSAQMMNQQLSNAVTAINSVDDQKIIDDLRRQLEEELAKLKKCQQDYASLVEENKKRDSEMKKLKDLINKLEADKAKLNAEKDKLQNELQSKPHLEERDGKDKIKIGKHDDVLDKQTKDDVRPVNDKYKDKDLDKSKVKTTTTITITPKRTLDDNAKSNEIKDDRKNVSNENKKARDDIIKTTESPISKDVPKQKPIEAAALPLRKPAEPAASGDRFVDETKPPKPVLLQREAAVSKIRKTDKDKAAALDDFVKNKSDTFKLNLTQGRGFQKELRKILEEFIQECGFCFCRLVNPNSKLYIICHKLYHCGINTLSFRELAYLHKKIYARAEQLVPGCLLDMILSDNKEQVGNMLSVTVPRLGGGAEIDYKLSDTNITEIDPKCCLCKNELCCNNSDEMLKDKVNKLEKDFEIAREYLESLANIPLDVNITTENDDGDSTDTNNDNSTYRATSNLEIVRKSNTTSQHLKKIKARLNRPQDNLMCRL